MRRFNRLITAALCSTICSAMLVPAAYAQTAQSSDDSGDEPIIVTATVRAMDVQDIPLAVTAVAPEALERQGAPCLAGCPQHHKYRRRSYSVLRYDHGACRNQLGNFVITESSFG